MRYLLLSITLIFFHFGCGQNNTVKLTVILYDNQHPGLAVTTDTLLSAKEIDLSVTPIDLYFTWKNFQLPYYVPTDGIYKNVAKDKECDPGRYPATIKCYTYDQKNRVIKMAVTGSGIMKNFTYSYNDLNQITGITDFGTNYSMTYNKNGTLREFRQSDGVINKKMVFSYENLNSNKTD